MTEKIICSGFGGQGVLSLGQIISLVAMNADKHVSWIPAYGAEMRGGTANCSVIYSDEMIGSPIITNDITILIAMNQPSVDKFINDVVSGGVVIVNSSVVDKKITREDVTVYYVPATDIAFEIGSAMYQNMVILGSLLKAKDAFTMDLIETAFKEKFSGPKEKFIKTNMQAVMLGKERTVQ